MRQSGKSLCHLWVLVPHKCGVVLANVGAERVQVALDEIWQMPAPKNSEFRARSGRERHRPRSIALVREGVVETIRAAVGAAVPLGRGPEPAEQRKRERLVQDDEAVTAFCCEFISVEELDIPCLALGGHGRT